MSIKRMTAAALVASLFVGVAPATAWAAGDDSIVTSAAPAPSKLAARIDFKAAAERAIASAVVDQVQAQAVAAPTGKKTGTRYAASGGGGGGGTTMMIVGLLASVAGTYFIYKEMTKETDQLTKSAQQSQSSGFRVR